MKLHFEDNLDYQQAAIDSVVSLFKGQEVSRSEFTVTFRPDSGPNLSLGMDENQLGVGNRLLLVDDEGRISRIRKAKAVTRYCRRSCDMHTPINVRKALLRAVDALSNDNRLLTLLGLRVGSEMYLDQIEYNAV